MIRVVPGVVRVEEEECWMILNPKHFVENLNGT